MGTKTPNAVESLDFGPKTVKRATFEAFEFTVVGPHLIEVTNASYGAEKDDHSYTVGIEDRDGLAIPAECSCPADVHGERDCKHKVALASVGGPTVLNAALETELRTDGGDPLPGTCTQGVEWCDGGRGEVLPCFSCFLPNGGRK
jgi:hypothetical protein